MEDQKPFRGLQGKTPEALFGKLRTPCYILDERILRENGKALKDLMDRTGCRVLLAQKAFSNYDLYPVLAPYLAGTEASGLYEARLGRERCPKERSMSFPAPTETMKWMRSFSMPTMWSLIPQASCAALA